MSNWLPERLAKKLGNPHQREMLLGSAVALLVKVIAAAAAFLMNLVVARSLGASEAGLFFFGFTLITLLAAIARMGLDNSLVRFVAAEHSQQNSAAVHGVYRTGVIWVAGLSVVVMGLLLLLNGPLNHWVFSLAGFDQVLWIMAFALPLVALYTLHAQALQGLKRIAPAMLTLNVLVPLGVLVVLLLTPVHTAKQVAWVYVLACGSSLLFGWLSWRRSVPATPDKPVFDSRVLLASCLPLWGVMLFSQMVQWSSQLMLGVWGTTTEVALFASAQRTAMLTSFVLVAVNAIAAPRFAAMHRQGDMQGLRRTALLSVRLMLLAALPIVLFMLLFPEWLMGLFGPEFIDAAPALVILVVGQFVNIATGSVGFLLSMTGHERQLRLNVFIGATLGVGLGLLLIPAHGLLGGAIATAVAVASQNLLGVYQVNKLLGFNTLAIWRRI
ncbi:oligosaccharide flippase family protein [Halopseudomonas pachastrellae]|uniref:oligosaccharide flippase family protein n=1 Tax=Halopseudomonas pachastrellae TaxID=254161 RepID=UPI003D7CA9A4